MANIRVDLDYTIRDGLDLKFRSPVDCSQITGLIVYYPGEDGEMTSQVFALADAHGSNVGDIDHLFAEDVVVKVILDVTKGMAFVQNADTNAYLEAQLASKASVEHTHTAADVGAAPASHASNKSNPHGVTAAQVGARPDTWIPTAKELGFTGAVSTILSNDFATSRALVSNSSGKAASSSVTSTELGYLSGVTSSVQTQLDDRLQLTIGTSIASNSDLNTFKTPGKYYCGTGSIAGTLSNSPSSSTGFGLIVTDSYIKGRVYQIALMSNNSIKFRYYNATSWQPWNTVLTNILPSGVYGESLPAAGTAGRIFFKKVSS